MLKRFQPRPKPHGVNRRVHCLKALKLYFLRNQSSIQVAIRTATRSVCPTFVMFESGVQKYSCSSLNKTPPEEFGDEICLSCCRNVSQVGEILCLLHV